MTRSSSTSADTATSTTITFPNTLTLWSGYELDIDAKNLTIHGPGAGLLSIASGPNNTVSLSGLTISNGEGRFGGAS
jgi:hypothetical protein